MSEIEDLKNQIIQIDTLLAEEKDDVARRDLEQTKPDLLELVELMEEDEESQEGTSENAKEEKEAVEERIEDDNSTDTLLGSRCMAPFDSDRSLPLHTAIIMDIESSSRVRVLFSHPTCPAMKPCSHFLASTCRYNENCRFSHGYSVELERIEDYQEPDFMSIVEQGLVLVKGSSELWEIGRISAIDGQNVAVKLLKSGSEVSSKRKDLVPLGEIEEKEKKTNLGESGNWNVGGIGMKLMAKMGYKVGEGLGKRSDGIVHAIQARICAKNASLDEVMTRKRRVVDRKDKSKRIMILKTSDESEKDIFAFINRKLETKSERTMADVRKEKEEMAGYTSKALGSKKTRSGIRAETVAGEAKKIERRNSKEQK
ncbi:Protein CBG13754 [Caenorhabditis briggsae]|uniref:Zinc finger CCCH-type with G patch domain-containing protein n=3 Tax=Caenorhabditis briggsae TaxID=6238 RepID=A8XIM0_CAEBR|nr:Protein CBG13754 [Caenorhabditis briggsae]CAP32495.2 Protein CBG13754 [Caenorhabditis briggsae]